MTAVAKGTRPWPGRRAFLCLATLAFAPTGCGDDPTATTPDCEQAPRLVPGETVSGQLTGTDPERAGVAIDYYSVLPPDSTIVVVRMASPHFDPFLYLLRENGDPVAQAFDPAGEEGGGSITLTQAVGARCHLVGASGWSPASRGEYSLELEIAPGG